MTGWDVLDKVIANFPPVVMALLLIAVLVAVVILIVGFARYGANFLKYGFKQTEINDLGSKIDGLRNEFKSELETIKVKIGDDIYGLRAEFKSELETIKVNHFGHLKNYLAELNGILLDRDVINNQDKARLDNQLRGM